MIHVAYVVVGFLGLLVFMLLSPVVALPVVYVLDNWVRPDIGERVCGGAVLGVVLYTVYVLGQSLIEGSL